MSLEDNQTVADATATGATGVSEAPAASNDTAAASTTEATLKAPEVGSKEAGLAAARAAFEKHADKPEGAPTGATGDKVRGPDGKFAPKAGDATQADPNKPASANGTTGDPQKPLAVVEVPNYVPAKLRDDWQKTPESMRQWAQQREAQVHDQISQQGRQLAAYRPVGEVLNTYSDHFKSDGVDPVTGLKNAMEWQALARRDPATFVRSFAERNNIDLVSLITDPEAHQQRSQQTFLEQRLETLERELRTKGQYEAEQQTYQQEQRMSTLTNAVEQFAATAPDFEFLTPDITALIPAIRAVSPHLTESEILQQAHERARWANPVTRSKLESERKAIEDRSRIEAQKKAAAAAKAASSINVTSAPSNSPAVFANAQAAAAAAWERGMSK